MTHTVAEYVTLETSSELNRANLLSANFQNIPVPVKFYIDGTLAAVTDVFAFVVPRSMYISKVWLHLTTPGTASSTILDVNKNGLSLFTDQDKRPTLVYSDIDSVIVSGTPDTFNLNPGDVLTVDIDQVSTGAAGLAVTIELGDALPEAATNTEFVVGDGLVGEHPVILNGVLYATFPDIVGSGHALKTYNPADGTLLKSYAIANLSAASVVIDNAGLVHAFANGTMWKINTATDATSTQAGFATGVDFEALVYDPVNDWIFVPNGTGISAVRASDYSTAWANNDPDLASTGGGGSRQISPVLLVGNTLFVLDYDATIWKINATTGATIDSLNLSAGAMETSYSHMIYDAQRGYIYAGDGGAANTYAVNVETMAKVWTRNLAASGYTIKRGGAYHNDVLYMTTRETASPYRSKVYALDVDNSGAILWTNTTAYDNGGQVSGLLVDDRFVYCTTFDYTDGSYSQIFGLNIADGSLRFSYDLTTGASSAVPAVYGGKFFIGLWNSEGLEAKQIRAGGGVGNFYWRANRYQTGYIGPYTAGNLEGE